MNNNIISPWAIHSFSSVGTVDFHHPHYTDGILLKPTVFHVTGSGNFTLDIYGSFDLRKVSLDGHACHNQVKLMTTISSFGIYQYNGIFPPAINLHCSALVVGGGIGILTLV